MRILVYGINYSPELTGIGKYSGEMAGWLASKGHDVRVVTAPPYYPLWKIGEGYSGWKYKTEKMDGVKVLRCPLWVPKHPSSLTRMIHLISFTMSSLPQLFRNCGWKPDLILCVAPTFFCAPNALLFGMITGGKTWLHVQDFEIDAMFGLGMLDAGRTFARYAYRIESLLFRLFDSVSSISLSMCRRLEDKNVPKGKIVHFPNWVDTSFLTPEGDRRKYRQMWGFKETDIIILYSGNLGKKQGLNILLEVAESLRNRNNYHFVIVGEGADKRNLLDQASAMGLANVHFYPLQPYDFLPELLRMADIHLVLQKKGAADMVMPSKLTGILAVGGYAIITAEKHTELGRIVMQNPGIAVLIQPEDAAALEEAIVDLAERNNPQTGIGHNVIARRYAEENLSIDSVLLKLERKAIELALAN